MTNMKRLTVSLPVDIDAAIWELKRNDPRYERCSYSEIVRDLVRVGLSSDNTNKKEA